MVPVESILRPALAQAGKSYVFGAQASAADPSPKAFDCSELVKWACARAGVTPTMPDGTMDVDGICGPVTSAYLQKLLTQAGYA